MSDDNYKPNTGYVIGYDKERLYSHIMDGDGIIYVSSVYQACIFEHLTDARIQIYGMRKDGTADAHDYKIFKVVCDVTECDNCKDDL